MGTGLSGNKPKWERAYSSADQRAAVAAVGVADGTLDRALREYPVSTARARKLPDASDFAEVSRSFFEAKRAELSAYARRRASPRPASSAVARLGLAVSTQ